MKPTEPNTKDNTPKHCWDCWKFAECTQAQNMAADTEAVEGWICCNGHYCVDCLITGTGDSPLDWEELDYPAHCENCGVPLKHSLTPDGVQHVREHLGYKDKGGCCRELWPRLFSEYLKEEE